MKDLFYSIIVVFGFSVLIFCFYVVDELGNFLERFFFP